MAAELEIRAKVFYRGELIEVVIEDIYDDPRDRHLGLKRLNVRAVEGKPFHEWNVQISDPKYGGGSGWESLTSRRSVSILAVHDVWFVRDGVVTERLGMPPAAKKYHKETNRL